MNEVRVLYGRDPIGQWSAKVSGAFDAKFESETRQEARRKVAAALASHGTPYPFSAATDVAWAEKKTIAIA